MIPEELLKDRGATIKNVKAGEIFFEENAPASFYYHILTGRVRISNFMPDGKEVLHKVVCQNEGFGEVAIFDETNHLVSAVADWPSSVLKLPAKAFLAILKDHPKIHMSFTQQIAHDLLFESFMKKLVCNHSPEYILTNLIQRLNTERKLVCNECNLLMLTRQQLANMTGLRVETIIRTMKQMQKDDKLNIVRGKVFIPFDGLE